MKMTERLAFVRQRVASQREWIAKHGGDLNGYIAHYGDPGRAPLDANGNCQTITCPPELAEACGLRPVPNAAGCYYKEHFGSGGTLIYEADKNCLDRYERELAELEPRYGRYLNEEVRDAVDRPDERRILVKAYEAVRQIQNRTDMTGEQQRFLADAERALHHFLHTL